MTAILAPVAAPRGIQRKREKGWRMPPDTVYVGRGSAFGNPFRVDVFGRDQAVALNRGWLEAPSAEALGYTGDQAAALNAARAKVYAALPSLRGKNLACWCAEPAPGERDRCHRAVLLELANG